MKPTQHDYTEMLRGYTAGKNCTIRPARIPRGKSQRFRDAFKAGMRFQDKYQQRINREMIG